jgi:hypothetical protein
MRTNRLNPTRSIRAGRQYRLVEAVDEGLLPARRFAQEYPICVLALIATLGALHPTPAAAANTYQVDTTGDPGPPGTLSLRQAITTANASTGDTVEFAPALVGSTITLASGQIDITKAMTIAGPGAGALTISGQHASRIFYIDPIDYSSVSISGLTLTEGNSVSGGGAIRSLFANLTVSNSIIRDSTAFRGGGIYSIFANLTVSNSIIRDSTARDGGGIFAYGSEANVEIDNSRLTGNLAAKSGGGLFAQVGDTFLLRNAVDGNTAGELGGGIFTTYGYTVWIQGSTISGNMVPQPSGYNAYTHGGGGIALNSVGAVIYNSTIAQNYAYTNGGGVALLDAITADNTLFYMCTIVGNAAQPYETGIGISSAGGNSTIYSTIVANNVSAGTNVADDLAGSFSVNFSLIKTPGGASITVKGSLIGPDPQLGPLADNGGPTLTMLPATTSPVINAAFIPEFYPPTADQRGAPRAIADHFDDMGAVERQYPEDLIFRSGFNPL